MTRTQVKSRIKKLLEQLDEIQVELEDLQSEVEETKDEIEPYEGYNDLTPEQEERQEWLEEVYDALQTAIDNVQDAYYELEDKQ